MRYIPEVQLPPIVAVDWRPAGAAATRSAYAVRIIDQRLLPGAVVLRDLVTVDDVVEAIRTLAVRGAPAIGVAGAMGVVAGLADLVIDGAASTVRAQLPQVAARIRAARPTAVNLPWAVDRMLARAERHGDDASLLLALADEATAIRDEDRAACAAIGRHGASLLAPIASADAPLLVVTHCNAGALATAGEGTALAPLYAMHADGVALDVYVDETRPLLQGARLTAWELARAGIAVTLIPDSAAATVLRRSPHVGVVLVGADRIARNGDVANKLGTYPLALAAREHGHLVIVCAPSSTIDRAAADGSAIVIEERDADEVTCLGTQRIAADGVAVFNPAFDVTPRPLISAYLTEQGLVAPPFA
jgi:methylthioribose-1-phosphate isomerase